MSAMCHPATTVSFSWNYSQDHTAVYCTCGHLAAGYTPTPRGGEGIFWRPGTATTTDSIDVNGVNTPVIVGSCAKPRGLRTLANPLGSWGEVNTYEPPFKTKTLQSRPAGRIV